MKSRLYFTIDFEDTVNRDSTKACGKIIDLFCRNEVKPLIFITGAIVDMLHHEKRTFKKEISKIRLGCHVGYHTNSHTPPTVFAMTDTSSKEVAEKNVIEREQIKGKGSVIFNQFEELFGTTPVCCRFPGFSWTPTYVDALKGIGIKNFFDLFPSGLERLPTVTSVHGVKFIKPGYVLWLDELVRDADFETAKREVVDQLVKFKVLNVAVHPNRFCNKGWWLDYLEDKSLPPRFSSKETTQLLKKLDKIVSFIRNTSVSLFLFRNSLDLRELDGEESYCVTEQDIRTIFVNAAHWPSKRYHYTSRFLHARFREYFL